MWLTRVVADHPSRALGRALFWHDRSSPNDGLSRQVQFLIALLRLRSSAQLKKLPSDPCFKPDQLVHWTTPPISWHLACWFPRLVSNFHSIYNSVCLPEHLSWPHRDTLLIMQLPLEYQVCLPFFSSLPVTILNPGSQYAREHVRTIDWGHSLDVHAIRNGRSHVEPTIPFFETVIRCKCASYNSKKHPIYLYSYEINVSIFLMANFSIDVGGLISAFELSGDTLMLRRAEELADWLLPAFATFDGFPLPRYYLGTWEEFSFVYVVIVLALKTEGRSGPYCL